MTSFIRLPPPPAMGRKLLDVFRQAWAMAWMLYKIIIPMIILVKILIELDLIKYLAVPLEPLMSVVGLPPNMGLVWATALMAGVWSAFLLYLTLLPVTGLLTVAQVTVLSTLVLIAHAIPVEARIAQRSGLSFWGQATFRVAGAFVCAMLFHQIFTHFDILQEISRPGIAHTPENVDLAHWALAELHRMVAMFGVIFAMMLSLRILDYLKILNLARLALRPLLALLGLSREASTIVLVGLTLGISYGGGLIIAEARSGRLTKRDVFIATSLMGLSHALVEDTFAMVLMGASLAFVFGGRLAFSLFSVFLFSLIYDYYLRRRRLKEAI